MVVARIVVVGILVLTLVAWGGPTPVPVDVPRSLSLDYSKKKRMLKGTLTSPQPACVVGELVGIMRKQKGADQEVEASTAANTGKFRQKMKKKGRYYAQVSARVVTNTGNCLAAKSEVVKVKPTRAAGGG